MFFNTKSKILKCICTNCADDSEAVSRILKIVKSLPKIFAVTFAHRVLRMNPAKDAREETASEVNYIPQELLPMNYLERTNTMILS